MEKTYEEGFMDGVSSCCQIMMNIVTAIENQKDCNTVKMIVGAGAKTMADILNKSVSGIEMLKEQEGSE